jgi:hypothetical protein
MAKVTIVYEDNDDTGEVDVKQHWEPVPAEGEHLTKAQVLGFKALGVDVENSDPTDIWETNDGPDLGHPI